MKKLFVILCITLFASTALAIDWHKADSVVVAWDAPTTYADGTPIDDPGIMTFRYDVYTKDVNGSNVVMQINSDTTEAVIALQPGEKKLVGVAAYATDADGIETGPSEVAWSDDPISCLNGNTFGVHNLKAPGKPGNLRKN